MILRLRFWSGPVRRKLRLRCVRGLLYGPVLNTFPTLQSYKSQLKQETANAKRSIREMELTLAESTALSAKSEREYITLRDSMKHMVDGWKADVERLREDMGRKEREWKEEAAAMAKKYEALCQLVEEGRSACASFHKFARH